MADIHPYVLELIEPLLRSRLSNMGELAIARINAAEQDAAEPAEERDPLRPVEGETLRDRGFRQLKLADQMISGLLENELRLFDRNRALTRRLQAGLALRGDPRRFETIYVTPDPRAEKPEDLLTGARRQELEGLREAWEDGRRLTTERLQRHGDR